MRKYSCLLSTVFLLLLSPKLSAFFCCDEWGGLQIEGEWLYFRPTKTDYSVTVVDTSSVADSTIKPATIVPSYQSGWRVKGAYIFCGCDDELIFSWTQLRTHDKRNYFAGLSFSESIVFTTTQASESFRFSYDAMEALYKHRFYCDCRFLLNFLGGVQYTWIGYKDYISFPLLTAGSFQKESAHYWGVGPEFGTDARLALCYGFSLTGRATGALLIGSMRENIKAIIAGSRRSVFMRQPIWRVVPAYDLRGGLRFDGCCTCFNYFVEAGYEAINYLAPFTLAFANTANAGMHGPYVGAGATF